MKIIIFFKQPLDPNYCNFIKAKYINFPVKYFSYLKFFSKFHNILRDFKILKIRKLCDINDIIISRCFLPSYDWTVNR